MLKLVAEITHHMQNREYVKANDAYIRMSIGTAAWPIGVTAVGIHARSARERIHIDQVAHVLNDEVSRKWIQSLKRYVCDNRRTKLMAQTTHLRSGDPTSGRPQPAHGLSARSIVHLALSSLHLRVRVVSPLLHDRHFAPDLREVLEVDVGVGDCRLV